MDQLIEITEEKPARGLPVLKLVDSFLRAQDVKEISRTAYRKGLERFVSWLSAGDIAQPDRESVLQFKACLIEAGLAANTVNSYLVAVKRFFAFLEGTRMYPNVAKDVKGMKQARGHLRESLTAEQIKDLLAGIPVDSLRGKRDYAMVNLMARTGLRTIEVVRANVEDIKQQGGEALLYVQGKGKDSKDAFVLLTEKSLKPVLTYLKARGKVDPGAPLFASLSDRNNGRRLTTRTVRKVIKDYLGEINIESRKLTAHSLRHSFATLSLRAGAPLLQVKEALRHASIETTERYLHNIERIEKGAERYIDF